jgi:hypothetical protein
MYKVVIHFYFKNFIFLNIFCNYIVLHNVHYKFISLIFKQRLSTYKQLKSKNIYIIQFVCSFPRCLELVTKFVSGQLTVRQLTVKNFFI